MSKKKLANLEFAESKVGDIAPIVRSNEDIQAKLSSINPLEQVVLKECGSNNNLDNFQIFTPRFIVDDMIKAIGVENITNNEYRILEPTSGDGAFTCRILELRLNRITSESRDDIFRETLESLSTIYSIEMDEGLIKRQRDNIYTISVDFLESKDVRLNEDEDLLLRLVISLNFVWGMTNMDNPPTLLICEVAYEMPAAEKNKFRSIDFPVWEFKKDSVSLHYEAPEVGY